MDRLLSGNDLKVRIESLSSEVSELTLVTAYIKRNAVDWLASLLKSNTKVNIITRITPQDILSGASDIDAIEFAIKKNWACFRLSELHAKLYLINNKKLFVGSANFTSRGLLLYGSGNLEATIEVDVHQSHIDFIDKILSKSTPLYLKTIIEMKNYLQKCASSNQEPSYYWDDDLFSPKELWSSDLPWLSAQYLLDDKNFHDRDLFNIEFSDNEKKIREKFKKSRGFLWLCSQLNYCDNRVIFFGKLSSILHDALQDDPSLYRKDVKMLLSNLLSYCNCYASDLVVIDRPNYSERITLLEKHP